MCVIATGFESQNRVGAHQVRVVEKALGRVSYGSNGPGKQHLTELNLAAEA